MLISLIIFTLFASIVQCELPNPPLFPQHQVILVRHAKKRASDLTSTWFTSQNWMVRLSEGGQRGAFEAVQYLKKYLDTWGVNYNNDIKVFSSPFKRAIASGICFPKLIGSAGKITIARIMGEKGHDGPVWHQGNLNEGASACEKDGSHLRMKTQGGEFQRSVMCDDSLHEMLINSCGSEGELNAPTATAALTDFINAAEATTTWTERDISLITTGGEQKWFGVGFKGKPTLNARINVIKEWLFPTTPSPQMPRIVIVFCHGGLIKKLLSELGDYPYKEQNAGSQPFRGEKGPVSTTHFFNFDGRKWTWMGDKLANIYDHSQFQKSLDPGLAYLKQGRCRSTETWSLHISNDKNPNAQALQTNKQTKLVVNGMQDCFGDEKCTQLGLKGFVLQYSPTPDAPFWSTETCEVTLTNCAPPANGHQKCLVASFKGKWATCQGVISKPETVCGRYLNQITAAVEGAKSFVDEQINTCTAFVTGPDLNAATCTPISQQSGASVAQRLEVHSTRDVYLLACGTMMISAVIFSCWQKFRKEDAESYTLLEHEI